jgi:PAS domain S-box-containing protein
VFDAEWRYTYATPAARAIHAEILAHVGAPEGLRGGSVVGRVAWEVFPWLVGTKFELESRRAVAERRIVEYVEHVAPLDRWYETRIVPLATGAIALNRDVTERRRGEAERERLLASERQAADRARRLQRLTAQLNEATSREQIAQVIFEGALAAVGADAGSLALVHVDADGRPAHFETVRAGGYAREMTDRYRTFPLKPGRPLSDTVLRRDATFVASPEEWRTAYPDATQDLTQLGYAAFVAIPVIAGERVLAALSFSFREPRAFDEATRTFLATLGEQCALALERQRLHEAELHHSARHAALLTTIQDALVALDRDRRYTYVNAQAEAMLGRPAAELLGRTLDDVFPEARGTPVYAAIQHTLDTGRTHQVEAFSVVARRWVEARLYPAPDGVTLVLQDVTARRRAQDAAAFTAEASRLLATTLDYATTLRAVAEAAVPRLGDWCAVDIVVDPTTGAWPPQVERLAVVHQDPAMLALGAELMQRYPTDWSAEQGMAAVLRTGTPFFVPEVSDAMLVAGARDADHLALLRAVRFSSIIVVPLLARGLTLGALTLCMTESERRYDDADLALAQDLAQRAATAIDNARLYRDVARERAEAQRERAEAERQRSEAERARADAEAANQAKSQFLATMSHELRTPLNAIGGYTDLLDIGIHGPITEAQREALARVRRSQQHLLGLINEVLNYARLEAGSVRYDVTAVSVADALVVVESLVRPQVLAKGLTLVVEPCDPHLAVRADAEKLRQVLLNLLSNAIKFTDVGGRITVACALAQELPDAGAHDRWSPSR